MKKAYEPPKVELLEFDRTDIVCASDSPRLTEYDSVAWKCERRIVDVMNQDRTVCGYV